jgi:putative oxidoreductase
MRYATLGVSILLGFLFAFSAIGFFFNLFPMPPMEGNMAKFSEVLMSTGFMKVIKVIELACGVMLMTGFQRPLATILIAPIVVGILLVEICIVGAPSIGVVMLAALAFLLYAQRDKFMGILS